jgi:predicted solute-binding protein
VPFFHKCPQEIHLIICIYLHRPICFVCVQGNLQGRRRNAVTNNSAAVNIILKQVLLQMCLWKNLFQRLYIVNNCSKV